MANYEATRYDFDAANLTGIQGVNTGIVVPWSDASIPSGFLECNGSAVSRTTYSGLFAVVGTTYGIGDGSTTFNVPDFQGKCCQNLSPSKALASSGGATTVTATGNVAGNLASHTLSSTEIATHTHPLVGAGSSTGTSIGNGSGGGTRSSGSTGGGGGHSHTISGASLAGDAKSVLQKYITLVYIIKT